MMSTQAFIKSQSIFFAVPNDFLSSTEVDLLDVKKQLIVQKNYYV